MKRWSSVTAFGLDLRGTGWSNQLIGFSDLCYVYNLRYHLYEQFQLFFGEPASIGHVSFHLYESQYHLLIFLSLYETIHQLALILSRNAWNFLVFRMIEMSLQLMNAVRPQAFGRCANYNLMFEAQCTSKGLEVADELRGGVCGATFDRHQKMPGKKILISPSVLAFLFGKILSSLIVYVRNSSVFENFRTFVPWRLLLIKSTRLMCTLCRTCKTDPQH